MQKNNFAKKIPIESSKKQSEKTEILTKVSCQYIFNLILKFYRQQDRGCSTINYQ